MNPTGGTPRPYQFTEAADADITRILSDTNKRFGPMQRAYYAWLIDRAAGMIAETPDRVASRRRDDLGDGIRSFHLELAAGRRGAASHILYYALGQMDDGTDGVIIVRVRHEGMDPIRHVTETT